MKQYIFGYGSLIEKESRTQTVPQAPEPLPVKVMGLTRGWWARTRVDGFSSTFLGCLDSRSPLLQNLDVAGYTNGVIFEVQEQDIQLLDLREKNYTRIQINPHKIIFYKGAVEKDATIWVYVNTFAGPDEFFEALPTRDCPIVQSYVDICLNGCIEIEQTFEIAGQESFLAEFISSTHYWSAHWANDRIYPRRPHIYCPNATLIDGILKQRLREYFDNIYIE
jgi:cation transport regulator ChaC